MGNDPGFLPPDFLADVECRTTFGLHTIVLSAA